MGKLFVLFMLTVILMYYFLIIVQCNDHLFTYVFVLY